jgi:peptide/nickel transport system permease protein
VSKKITSETPFRRLVSNFIESRIAVGAFGVLVCIVLIAVFAPWISPQNPYDLAQINILNGSLPP